MKKEVRGVAAEETERPRVKEGMERKGRNREEEERRKLEGRH